MVSADNISDNKMDMEDSGFVFDMSDREDLSMCPVSMLDLSDDVLLYILRYCSPRDLKALGFSCSRLGRLVCERSLWRHVDARSERCSRARLKWLLDNALHKDTLVLMLTGYSRDADGCMGLVNSTRKEAEREQKACREDSRSVPGLATTRICEAIPNPLNRLPDRLERHPARLFISAHHTQLPRQRRFPSWPEDGDVGRPGPQSCSGPQFTLSQGLLQQLSARCPQLTTLGLEYCNIDCSSTCLGAFPRTLKKLSLRGSKCYNMTVDKSFLFKIQDYLPNLESLDVSECEWMDPATLLPLSKMAALQELIMRDCYKLAEFVAYASLTARYGFKALKSLDLRGSPVGDSEVSALGWLPRLERLWLSARRTPRTRCHAHYTDDERATHSQLHDWEAQEPDYFKQKSNPDTSVEDMETGVGDHVPAEAITEEASRSTAERSQLEATKNETTRNGGDETDARGTKRKHDKPSEADSESAGPSSRRCRTDNNTTDRGTNTILRRVRTYYVNFVKDRSRRNDENNQNNSNDNERNDNGNAEQDNGNANQDNGNANQDNGNANQGNDGAENNLHEEFSVHGTVNVEFNFDVNIRNGDRNGDNRNQNNGNDVNENGQGRGENGDRNNRCIMEIDIEPRRPKEFIVISAPRNNDRDSLYAPSSSRSGNGVHSESSDDDPCTRDSDRYEHDKKRDKSDKKRDKSADDQKPGPSNDNRNQKNDNGHQNNGNDKNNENERDGNGNGERNNECILQIDIDNPRRSNEVIVISRSRSNDTEDPQERGERFVLRNNANSGPDHVSKCETGNGVYSDSSDDEQCLCNSDSYENNKKRDKKGDKSVDSKKPGPSGDKSVNDGASTSRNAGNGGEKQEKYVMFRKNRDPVYMNCSPDNNERRDPLPPVQYQIEQRHHVLYIGVGAQQNTYRFPRDASEVLRHLNLVSSHVDASGLVTDFAMRRFGRADGEDVNIIHIGPEGPMVNGVQTRSRPDRSSLRFLSVTGYRNITDRSLVHLATAAPNLTFIDFSGTNVTESGAENFRSLRPDCDVVYSPFHDHDEEKREP